MKKLYIILFIFILVLSTFFWVCVLSTKSQTIVSEKTHLINPDSTSGLLANPKYVYKNRQNIHCPYGYPMDGDTTDDYILEKEQYVLSYSAEKNQANWVAWTLDRNWIGEEDRYDGRFISDTTLPTHFYRTTHDDYTNSGYDRGHIVRSKERTLNTRDNKATFLLTNVMPQTPDLNRGVWLRFEDYYLNRVIDEGKRIFLIAGGIYNNNTTLNNKGQIAIPDSCFKIALFTSHYNLNDNLSITDFQSIAVKMPNIEGIRRTPWQHYITTIDAIQNSTGYDFFMLLPDNIENVIESDKFGD
ncbi:MAG: DNA/RNA non-specific endonuclease [Bacteroidales bacterium]|nr:DNA/RNA non-specific endonuclease [Bacteroidales bacterium]